MNWQSIVDNVVNAVVLVSLAWLMVGTTRQVRQHAERLRVLELKTGWLRVQEGPGNRVAVEGALDALCITQQKGAAGPYVS